MDDVPSNFARDLGVSASETVIVVSRFKLTCVCSSHRAPGFSFGGLHRPPPSTTEYRAACVPRVAAITIMIQRSCLLDRT